MFSGNTPAFPAQWLYGLCRALPGDEFFLVTVACGLRRRRARLGPVCLHRLGISNGCQDHTVLPYASTWIVYTPHIAHEVHLALQLPLRAQRCRVHRILLRVRDDRDTPLKWGRTGGVVKLICPTG